MASVNIKESPGYCKLQLALTIQYDKPVYSGSNLFIDNIVLLLKNGEKLVVSPGGVECYKEDDIWSVYVLCTDLSGTILNYSLRDMRDNITAILNIDTQISQPSSKTNGDVTCCLPKELVSWEWILSPVKYHRTLSTFTIEEMPQNILSTVCFNKSIECLLDQLK